MAKNSYVVYVLVLLVAGYTAALASATTTTFIVGDDQGWMTGVDYVAWVKGKTFAIGDKLGEWSALLCSLNAGFIASPCAAAAHGLARRGK
jgi:hypothetical protein